MDSKISNYKVYASDKQATIAQDIGSFDRACDIAREYSLTLTDAVGELMGRFWCYCDDGLVIVDVQKQ